MNDSAVRGTHRSRSVAAFADREERKPLCYSARGAQVEVEVSLLRRGLGAGFAGNVRSQLAGRAVPSLTVELLDPLGVVATADTGDEGEFSFEGLASGVYHLRLTADDWKMGIFGLTA